MKKTEKLRDESRPSRRQTETELTVFMSHKLFKDTQIIISQVLFWRKDRRTKLFPLSLHFNRLRKLGSQGTSRGREQGVT